MITVTLYGRKRCHLCEDVQAELVNLRDEVSHQLFLVDIDNHPELSSRFGQEIPVVEIGPYQLKAPITPQQLLVTLRAARDSQEQNSRISRPVGSNGTAYVLGTADRISIWIARHWLLSLNLLFIIYLGLPILAPVLKKAGADLPAQVIYTAYSPLCHQLAFRSFFLFGEQTAYPRATAHVDGLVTFGRASGLDESDLIAARQFEGNPIMGYKIALCERDVAIYAAIILFLLIFWLTGRKIKPLHWAFWLLLAIGPIGLDGFSQLISQLPFAVIATYLPYRESTPFLRILTGFMFGFGTAWMGVPYVHESMQETLDLLDRKFARAAVRAL